MKEESDFRVGNTSFDSHFFVTISDYGVPLPECHSTGPINTPINLPLTTIVNMVERGVHVHPKDDIDSEKIFFFLKEYNRVAKQLNDNAGEVLNLLVEKAEDYFYKKVRFKIAIETSKEENANPNPFTKRIAPRRPEVHRYNNEFVANKLKKKKPRKEIDLRAASEHKMYEAFSQPNAVSADGRIVIDPNTIGGQTMPDAFDDISFGD